MTIPTRALLATVLFALSVGGCSSPLPTYGIVAAAPAQTTHVSAFLKQGFALDMSAALRQIDADLTAAAPDVAEQGGCAQLAWASV